MKTTFVNQNSENNIIKQGEKHLLLRGQDLTFYMRYGTDHTDMDMSYFCEQLEEHCDDIDEIEAVVSQFKNLPPFFEYGLCFDYVEKDGETEDYFRYQISWGGPSEEIRFYEDRTEFVYLDWFCGVGFDVDGEDWAEFLREWFDGCEMLDFHSKREEYID